MCEKAGKQVRFRPAEALKFDSVGLFYFPTPRSIQVWFPSLRYVSLSTPWLACRAKNDKAPDCVDSNAASGGS